ncbi:MAG TPA: hypothetical protein VMJ35_10685 [Dongiaceae bacterium]|nr:hypothetical protein [Dongiaceae bacterium]
MKVSMEPSLNQQTPAEQTPAATARVNQTVSVAVKSAPHEMSTPVPMVSSALSVQPPNVTFRRDNNGRIYYVVSDAQSGKELQEVPPQAVRNVAEGIDEYVKREQAKAHSALNENG